MSDPIAQTAPTSNESNSQINPQFIAPSPIEPADEVSATIVPPASTSTSTAMDRQSRNWQASLTNLLQQAQQVQHPSALAQNLMRTFQHLQPADRPHTQLPTATAPQSPGYPSALSSSRHSLQSSQFRGADAAVNVVINRTPLSRSSDNTSTIINFDHPWSPAIPHNQSQPDLRPTANLAQLVTDRQLHLQPSPASPPPPINNPLAAPESARDNPAPSPPPDAPQLNPDQSELLRSLVRYLPYVLIVLAKTALDHMDGILNALALAITFVHANCMVRQEVARQTQRSVFKLVRELVYIVLVIGVIAFMLESNNILGSVLFAHDYTALVTLRNLLFSVLVTDFVLKLATVALKILVTLLPGSALEYRHRGRVYLAIEAVSQMYRGLMPILPWLSYLLDAYVGYQKFLGVVFSAAYIVAKGSDLMQTAKLLKHASVEWFKEVSFGTNPTKEQLLSAGGQCPICHDTYASPVQLICSHIFCEACVGTWFDREQTCPLCRAKVANDPSWRDGATTMFLQLY